MIAASGCTKRNPALDVDAAIDAPPHVVDAAVDGAVAIDAAAVDAAAVDAPAIDAVVDAPPVDATPIDAPAIDAPAIDAPPAAICGNGIVEGTEACDDGNVANGDSCNSTCTVASCLVPVNYPTIQAAVSDGACATVYVSPGTYHETVAIARNVTVTGLTTGPAILDGQAAHTPMTITSNVVTLAKLTIRNGQAAAGGGIVNHGSLTLNGVTVSGNTASAQYGEGGGIYSDGPILTLNGSVVTGNHAYSSGGSGTVGADGGGISASTGTVTIMGGSSVDHNDVTVTLTTTCEGYGGGVFMSGGTLTVTGASIGNNVVKVTATTGTPTANGGGIAMKAGTLTVTGGAMVTANSSSSGYGGGIWAASGTINGGSSVTANTGDGIQAAQTATSLWSVSAATVSGNSGMGIRANNGSLAISNSTVSMNSTGGILWVGSTSTNTFALLRSTVASNTNGIGASGAFLVSNGGAASVTESTISGNTVTGSGNVGGLLVMGTASIVNSTFSGNQSSAGPGALMLGQVLFGGSSGALNLSNCTITANTSGGTYAAVDLELPMGGWFGNNIISGNLGGAGDCYTNAPSPALTSGGGNVVNRPSGCAIPAETNALVTNLGPLANNGGPTFTHALLAGSNAIDKGTLGCKNAGFGLLATDQRGLSRLNGAYCDAGAYEK